MGGTIPIGQSGLTIRFASAVERTAQYIRGNRIALISSERMFSPVREHVAQFFRYSARTAFAALLFFSPFALHRTLETRPVGNIFPSYTDFFAYASDVFVVALLAFWCLSLLTDPRPLTFGPWVITLPLLGLVALSWIGAATGLDTRLTAYHSVRFTLLLGVYLFLVNDRLTPIWVVIPLGLGILLQTVVGYEQFTLQRSLGLAEWGELTLNPAVSGISILNDGNQRILRAYGLTEHPNILGGFFAVGLLFLLGYFLASSNSRRARALVLPPLILGVIGLLLTFSRAAALAFLVGAALLLFFAAWRARTEVWELPGIVLALGLMLAAVTMPIIVNRQLIGERIGVANSFSDNPLEQRSFAERVALIESAARVFVGHGIVGVGNGALPLAMFKLDDQFPKQYNLQPAHFVLLDVMAELGVAGGFLWLWLLAAPVVVLWRRKGSAARDPWFVTTAAVMLALTVIGFLDYYPWLSVPGRVWQWGACGLFASAFLTERNTTHDIMRSISLQGR